MLTLQQAQAEGLRRVRQSDWPPDEFVELPHQCQDGSYGHYAVYVSGDERASMLFATLDTGTRCWEPVVDATDTLPDGSVTVGLSDEDVASYVLRFGPYQGRTLEDIAKTDEGLIYLDRIVDELWVWQETQSAIRSYLSNEVIQRELTEALR